MWETSQSNENSLRNNKNKVKVLKFNKDWFNTIINLHEETKQGSTSIDGLWDVYYSVAMTILFTETGIVWGNEY